VRLGEALKERGQQLALFNAGEVWQDHAMAQLRRFAAQRGEFTMEQFRYEFLTQGNDEPPSPNCWGALTTAAQRAGVIEHTGKYVKAVSARTRAHRVSVWKEK